MKNIIVIIAALAIVLTGCKKYEEGPSLSLRTKKARLVGEYSIAKYTYNGADQTDFLKALFGDAYQLHFEKDGTYHIHGNFPDDGTWKFNDDKTNILLTSSKSGATQQTLEILKLENKEIWYKHTTSGGDIEEAHWIEE